MDFISITARDFIEIKMLTQNNLLDVGQWLVVFEVNRAYLWDPDALLLVQSFMSFFMPSDFIMNKVDQTETSMFESLEKTSKEVIYTSNKIGEKEFV